MVFFIKISSKNKETLQLFLMFLSKLENNNLLIKYFPKQKIKKFVTVLKSPHINKSAQEQFEFRVYTKKLQISSPQHLKFLYFLKKSQITIFPFINLKLEGTYGIKSQLNLISTRLDPIKFNTKFFNQNKFKSDIKSKKLIQYFNLLDCYGEYCIKKLINSKISSIFSSVG
jgi:ribosomal protein S10